MKYILLILSLCIFSCRQAQRTPASPKQLKDSVTANAKNSAEEEQDLNEDDYNYQDQPFKQVKNYPAIADTAAFIKALKRNCHVFTRSGASLPETINYFKQVAIFGSNKPVYLVEYDFHGGPEAEFPWKAQYIFDSSGKLLKILNEVSLQPTQIFPGKKPFLFALSSTAKGNGIHEVFRIRKDTIEQVYDGFLGNRPQTYSTGYSFYITQPNELNHTFADVNNDGFNDIVFYGKLKFDPPGKRKDIPVKYIFLYHPYTGHFTEQEDYSKKYEYIYGNTK